MSERPLKHVSTSKLEFILGVGRAGLKEWKGRKLAEVKQRCLEIETELVHRQVEMSRGNQNESR